MEVTALGMIETSGLLSAIEAADAGLKAADVRLLGTDYVRGGLVMVRFEGDVAAVQAAVDAGAAAAQRVGNLLSAHVIPRAMPEVFCMLASDPSVGPGKRYQGGCAACGGCEGGMRELKGCHPPKARPKAEEAPVKPDPQAGTEAEVPVQEPEQPQQPEAGQTKPEQPETEPVKPPVSDQPDIKAGPTLEEMKSWKVVALRSYVRKLTGFPMTANEIRYANKAQLLDALKAYEQDQMDKKS